MAINDNLWITHGNQKRFAFELKTDEGKPVMDLLDTVSLEFVLQDLEKTEVLRITKSQIQLNQKYDEAVMFGWITVTISTQDSENLEVGLYRYAIQARWPDGHTHEWTFPRVMHVLADMIT